jgi:hypothetical protein
MSLEVNAAPLASNVIFCISGDNGFTTSLHMNDTFANYNGTQTATPVVRHSSMENLGDAVAYSGTSMFTTIAKDTRLANVFTSLNWTFLITFNHTASVNSGNGQLITYQQNDGVVGNVQVQFGGGTSPYTTSWLCGTNGAVASVKGLSDGAIYTAA